MTGLKSFNLITSIIYPAFVTKANRMQGQVVLAYVL